jgi:thiol-disulfide isomerase/thioredoxin
MLIDLNEDTLQDLISKKRESSSSIFSSWCGNCRIMKPKFKRLASENDDYFCSC